MGSKIGKVRDLRAKRVWRLTVPQVCFLCGKSEMGFGFWLEIAHIIGGSGRSDEPCNLTLAHATCHASTHGRREIVNGVKTPIYTRLDLLRGKKRYDPDNWNPERLVQLMGEAIPELELL